LRLLHRLFCHSLDVIIEDMRLRFFAVVIFVMGLGLVAPAGQSGQPPTQAPKPAQQPPAQSRQQPPVIKAGINFVSVDVIVTDKKTGNVVLNLKPEDFDLREDKKPQKVQTFSVVRIDPSTEPTEPPKQIKNSYDEETEAKKPDVRLFVILLDDYHVRRGNDLAVRGPLLDFLQNDLAPQDMVAIMYPLTPVSDLSFSRNREAQADAINHFIGRKNDYTPRNEFEERYANYPTDQVEEIRNEVTLDALRGAAVKLGGMRDGRKSIVFVSEGFISTLPPQLSSPVAALPGFVNQSQPGQDAPNDPRSQAQQFFNSVDLTNRLREVYDTLNRNNTSMYAVDPRGLAATEYGIEQGVSLKTDQASLRESLDTLRVLADNSDGRAIVNRNDLATAMKQIVRDSSGYYLLGYTSTSAPTDGKFHTIDVKVNRPGVEVRARKGYWAYTNEEAAAAKAPPKPSAPSKVMDALNAVAEPARGDRAAQFWIGSGLNAAGQPQVTFSWEPLAPPPGQRAADLPSSVQLNVMAEDGTPLFNGRVDGAAAASSDVPSQGASGTDGRAAATTSGGSVSFKVPAGAVQLRMTVKGADGKVIDSDASTVTVPDYSKAPVAISTPRLYRARTAHEMLLLRHNPDTAPTPSRDFSRTEQILIRFDAYAGGGARPAVTARLLNRGGQPMADVPVQAADGQPFLIDFPLASLAAGEYVIEINAKASSGSAQQLIAFKITG
jgi:VWFA-related protein